jgi:hypothetical protein
MFNGFKIVAVTPAGREKYLSLLFKYILRYSDIIDRYDIWVNTDVPSDLRFIKILCNLFPNFCHPIYSKSNIKPQKGKTIYQFFPSCVENNTIYIRFDDDICYMNRESIINLLKFRCDNPNYFLIFPLIINNRMAYFVKSLYVSSHVPGIITSLDEHIRNHNQFLTKTVLDYYCEHIPLLKHEYVSINCFCWFGEDFYKFKGYIPPPPTNEERYLTVTKPQEIEKFNCICGNSLVVHFGFHHVEKDLLKTDLLQQYKQLFINFK